MSGVQHYYMSGVQHFSFPRYGLHVLRSCIPYIGHDSPYHSEHFGIFFIKIGPILMKLLPFLKNNAEMAITSLILVRF